MKSIPKKRNSSQKTSIPTVSRPNVRLKKERLVSQESIHEEANEKNSTKNLNNEEERNSVVSTEKASKQPIK